VYSTTCTCTVCRVRNQTPENIEHCLTAKAIVTHSMYTVPYVGCAGYQPREDIEHCQTANAIVTHGIYHLYGVQGTRLGEILNTA
jgi:hypothetical protein